ncbi:MAG: restriction endonuclease [Caldilineaceae bacterium]|jgi:hypothetical protein|nr:restriction endonuclease [Caldilineaceae bacterium]
MSNIKPVLTRQNLCDEAKLFASIESSVYESQLFGVSDGKAIGTYFEQKFRTYLSAQYEFEQGNSAKGIDFPSINVDMKVTRITQPQSSCPFKSARQKVYGLGYSLLVFVYDKIDDQVSQAARLQVLHTVFVEASRTADYQTTSGMLKLLENGANADDLVAFMLERFLPVDEVQAFQLAEEILVNPPKLGYLTISPALQWRLQYSRIIQYAGAVEGIEKVL